MMRSRPEARLGRGRKVGPDCGPLPVPKTLVMWGKGVATGRLLTQKRLRAGKQEAELIMENGVPERTGTGVLRLKLKTSSVAPPLPTS